MSNQRMDQEKDELNAHNDKGSEDDANRGVDFVDIFVNDISVRIHRGHQTGASIKAAAIAVPETGVSSVDVLYTVPEYTEISDTQGVVIHGGERFKTTAPDGASS